MFPFNSLCISDVAKRSHSDVPMRGRVSQSGAIAIGITGFHLALPSLERINSQTKDLIKFLVNYPAHQEKLQGIRKINLSTCFDGQI